MEERSDLLTGGGSISRLSQKCDLSIYVFSKWVFDIAEKALYNTGIQRGCLYFLCSGVDRMTQQEASEHYNIPVSILQEYESWGLCGAVKKVMGVWQYDDEDLEWLSTILTLHDIGFTTEEAETYMRLLLEQPDSTKKRLRMMEEKRNKTLGCILPTPNAPGQRVFLRCAASFFLEIRQYSCEKMSCAT
ncbi:MAG: MerR family transcriptional regulator [Oscillospiraceae bacterium]